MSLTNLNVIDKYWSETPFVGVKGFRSVIGKNRFKLICGALTFRPNEIDLLILYGFQEVF